MNGLIRNAAVLVMLGAAAIGQGGALNVCATVPDLGNLVSEIGGPEVSVSVFSKANDDPHFLEAKPSFIKTLATADLLVLVGLDLEVGWLPTIVLGARNSKVQPGTNGQLDVSTVIKPMEVPTGVVDRSMGHVHPGGNPHFLLDPLAGLAVAGAIRDRLAVLRPGAAQSFKERFAAFRQRVGDALVGADLAKKYDFEKLALLFERGKLREFLNGRKDADKLGGWLAAMTPYFGAKAVGEHNLYPYFARRFGLDVVGFFEPKPGVPPTTRHLTELLKTMKAANVRLILSAPYYDRKHANFMATHAGARVAEIAHQVGARPGATDYLAMVDGNVRQVVAALGGS
jgi:ABC-type Zn uptake system ZnuABC Zn-binding protein ZnuA